jgi:A/G-specific adenine glycosylase
VALVRSPDGWLVQRRPEKGLLAGLWQPVLWENETWESEAAARCALQALGLALGPETGTKNAEPLPPAKHIFSHIEWRMSGWRIDVPRQRAPAGCVWATPAQLREEYALPGAFKVYKGQMLQQVEKP